MVTRSLDHIFTLKNILIFFLFSFFPFATIADNYDTKAHAELAVQSLVSGKNMGGQGYSDTGTSFVTYKSRTIAGGALSAFGRDDWTCNQLDSTNDAVFFTGFIVTYGYFATHTDCVPEVSTLFTFEYSGCAAGQNVDANGQCGDACTAGTEFGYVTGTCVNGCACTPHGTGLVNQSGATTQQCTATGATCTSSGDTGGGTGTGTGSGTGTGTGTGTGSGTGTGTGTGTGSGTGTGDGTGSGTGTGTGTGSGTGTGTGTGSGSGTGSGNGTGTGTGGTGVASGDCQHEPTSTGDPQLAAILKQLWLNECGQSLTATELENQLKAKGLKDGDDIANVWDSDPDLKKDVTSDVQQKVDDVFSSAPSLPTSCPFEDNTIQFGKYGSVTFPISKLCDVLPIIRGIVVFMAYLQAAFILFGALRGGGYS